jgi:hypothetical protein
MQAVMQSYPHWMPSHSKAREVQIQAAMVTQAASGAGLAAAAAAVQQ